MSLGDDASDRLRAYTFVYDTVAEDEERSPRPSWLATSGSESAYPLDRYGWFEVERRIAATGAVYRTDDRDDGGPARARGQAQCGGADGGRRRPGIAPSPLVRLLRHRAPHLVVSEFADRFGRPGRSGRWPARDGPAVAGAWPTPVSLGFPKNWLSDVIFRARREVLAGRGTDEGPRGPAVGASADS